MLFGISQFFYSKLIPSILLIYWVSIVNLKNKYSFFLDFYSPVFLAIIHIFSASLACLNIKLYTSFFPFKKWSASYNLHIVILSKLSDLEISLASTSFSQVRSSGNYLSLYVYTRAN